MPSRRRTLALLAAGSVGALAGCATPGGALEMTTVETDTDVGVAATASVDPAETNEIPEIERLIDEALASGNATIEGRDPPFQPYRPVRAEGAVYDVAWTEVGERVRTEYVVTAEVTDDDPTGTEIALEDLPPVDRDKLAELRDRLDEETDDERIGVGFRYVEDSEIEASVLVPEPEYDLVVADGRPVRIETRETDAIRYTYRYELEERAPSVAAYGASLREERLVELGPLDGERAELVADAIDGGVVVGTDDEAFVAVGERLLENEPIYVDDREAEWLVAYEGEAYWTRLDALRTQALVDRVEAYEETGADRNRLSGPA